MPDRYVRASDFAGKLGQANNPDWKTVALDDGQAGAAQRRHRLPLGPRGPADAGRWNLEAKEAANDSDVKLRLSGAGRRAGAETAQVGFPYFAGESSEHFTPSPQQGGDVLVRAVPVQRIRLGKDDEPAEALVATVFDLQLAATTASRGLAARTPPRATTTTRPTRRPGRSASPACRARRRSAVARQFAANADKTQASRW